MKRLTSDKILAGALIGVSFALELEQWLQGRFFVLVPTAVAFITLVIAVMVLNVRRKWVPIVAIVESAYCLLSAIKSPDELDHLTHPATLAFIAAVIGLVTIIAALVAGINAVIHNYKLN